MKKCTKCNAEKESFPKSVRYKDGFSTWCSECHAEASKASRKKQANNDADYHKNNALRKHGLTPEKYEVMLAGQGGHCALCSATSSEGQRLSVDHNHAICAGKYACDKCRRGLLCSTCNAALGYLEQILKDTTTLVPRWDTWLEDALLYLTRYGCR